MNSKLINSEVSSNNGAEKNQVKIHEAIEIYRISQDLLIENSDKFAVSDLRFGGEDDNFKEVILYAITNAFLDSTQFSLSISLNQYSDSDTHSEMEEVELMQPAQQGSSAETTNYYGFKIKFEHIFKDKSLLPHSLGQTSLPNGALVEVVIDDFFTTINIQEAIEVLTKIKKGASFEVPEIYKDKPTYQQFQEWLVKQTQNTSFLTKQKPHEPLKTHK